MALKIRLRTISHTSKKRYNFRVVVIEQSRSRDGRVIEEIGHYDAAKKPATFVIDKERFEHWMKLGAQVSSTVKSLVKKVS
jgi:small subunit ribosomal protein S16